MKRWQGGNDNVVSCYPDGKSGNDVNELPKTIRVTAGKSKAIKVILSETLTLVSTMKQFNAAKQCTQYGATFTYQSSDKVILTVTKTGAVKKRKKERQWLR